MADDVDCYVDCYVDYYCVVIQLAIMVNANEFNNDSFFNQPLHLGFG